MPEITTTAPRKGMGKINRALWLIGLLYCLGTVDSWTGGRVKGAAVDGVRAVAKWYRANPDEHLGPVGKIIYARLEKPEAWTLDGTRLKCGSIELQTDPYDKDCGNLGVAIGDQTIGTGMISAGERHFLKRAADQVVANRQQQRREDLAALVASQPFPAGTDGSVAREPAAEPGNRLPRLLTQWFSTRD